MKPFSSVILGPPGTGKSTMAGSIAEVVKPSEVLALITKPGEEKSWLYQKYNITTELFFDRDWAPTLGLFKTEGFLKLMRRLRSLLDDEQYAAVIVDPGTDAITMLEHHIMAPHGVGSPGELDDTQGFYRQLGDKSQEFMTAAALLSTDAAKRPKYVIIPWHVQPAKEGAYVKTGGGGRTKMESADEKAQGIEYEGSVLPMLEGRYRRKLAGDVDIVIYCDLETKRSIEKGKPVEATNFFVQAAPNQERHAKLRVSRALTGVMLPNNMKALIAAMEEASK